MKFVRTASLLLCLLCGGAGNGCERRPIDSRQPAISQGTRPSEGILAHEGCCDASAAVALPGNRFVMANDEDNLLRVYAVGEAGGPIARFDVTGYIQANLEEPEADIEGAARIEDVVFWITSHGRNKDGELRLSRRRFFAARFVDNHGELQWEAVGRPYKNLVHDLSTDPGFAEFRFAEAAERAPKEKGGLNIEGLAATPNGHLLLGFRNPVPKGIALIIPIINPMQVLEGQRPQFGEPIRFDLEGMGIRSLEMGAGKYWIVAGPTNGKGDFRLYEWKDLQSAPLLRSDILFRDLNPEAFFFVGEAATPSVVILSDDGTRELQGEDCKDLMDPNDKYFRSMGVEL